MITSIWTWFAVIWVLTFYWLLPRYRDLILATASAALITILDWRSTVAVSIIGLAAFLVGRRATTLKKWQVGLFVVGAIGFLIYFKYIPGFLAKGDASETGGGAGLAQAAAMAGDPAKESGPLIPLGTSYFTFRLIAYVVDARRKQNPPHTLAMFLGYLFFFPMFPAGPIERFEDYAANRSSTLTSMHVAQGGSRIVYGLIKKFVVVDMLLAQRASRPGTSLLDAIPLFKPPYPVEQLLRLPNTNPLFAWQFVIHQFTTWYLDLSAYSDLAIGGAMFFGIRLVENFEWPMLASDPTQFWKRYHMSLSGWCQRYIYLPVMGRTRNPYVAVYATMMIMGLWHRGSVNYLTWGAYHATVLSIHLTWNRIKRAKKWKLKSRMWTLASTIMTVLAISASAVFPSTSAQGIGAAFKLMGMLVGIHG